MIKTIIALLFLSCLVFLNCSDNFSSNLDEDHISSEDAIWLVDDDNNGVADSIEKYVPDCEEEVSICLEMALELRDLLLDSLTASSPTFSNQTGLYTEPFELEITADNNALIYYTLDGTEPDRNSTLYTGPITINSSVTVTARAYFEDGLPSIPSQVEIVMNLLDQLNPPVFAVQSGDFDSIFSVIIMPPDSNSPDSVNIFYTINDSTPTLQSTRYTAPIVINQTSVVKAIAIKTGYRKSAVDSASYRLIPSAPTSSHTSGTYNSEIFLVLTTDVPGGEIRYTLDNTEPTDSSAIFGDSLLISTTTTVKAVVFKDGWAESELLTLDFTIKILGTVEGVVFEPEGGLFNSAQQVELSSPTEDAGIRYTLDGSDPDSNSSLYSDAITVNKNQLIKAFAFKEGLISSSIAEAGYLFKPLAPDFSPADTIHYNDIIFVEITAPGQDSVTLRYTLDGTLPDDFSPVYSSPIKLKDSAVVIARAFKQGWQPGLPDTAIYAINLLQITTAPNLSPEGGDFTEPVEVVLTPVDSGTVIFYTLDGSEPTTESIRYDQPFTLVDTTTVKAISVKAGQQNSPVDSAVFNIAFTGIDSAQAPVLSPEGGSFDTEQTITITSATPDARIYYTQDGSIPDTNSSLYASGIFIASSQTIRARAYKSGLSPSSISIGQYFVVVTDIHDATLADLQLDPGTLTPVFDPEVTSYSDTVDFDTDVITITATPTSAQADVRVNGNLIDGSTHVDLIVGVNQIQVKVYAEDDSTYLKYNLTIIRSDSDDYGLVDSRDGNRYRTVQIGEQHWMAENLRYTSFAIDQGCRAYDTMPCNYTGGYYDWNFATTDHGNGQDVCPVGWHLPTDDEWISLEIAIGLTQAEADPPYRGRIYWEWRRGTTQGDDLKSTDWDGTDAFGFNALPVGLQFYGGSLPRAQDGANFWTSTITSERRPIYRLLHSGFTTIERGLYESGEYAFQAPTNYLSVRCVEDSDWRDGLELASLTSSIGTITPAYSPDVNRYEVDVGIDDASVTLNATAVDNSAIIEVFKSGREEVNSSPSITPGDNLLKVRVSNATRTAQKVIEIVVTRPHQTFTDARDNITYKQITIGTQTWMAENLNYITDGDGSWCMGLLPEMCAEYGRLYGWYEATANTHGNGQDVCPAGWHLPSVDEWHTLGTFIAATDDGIPLDNNENTIGRKLKVVDFMGTDEFGFSLLPGRTYDAGQTTISNFFSAALWTSTQVNGETANRITVDSVDPILVLGTGNLGPNTASVRCIQNSGK